MKNMWGEFCNTYAPDNKKYEKSLEEIIQEDINKYQEDYYNALNSSERAYANGKIYSLRVLLRKLKES